jgi:hypothetical protein
MLKIWIADIWNLYELFMYRRRAMGAGKERSGAQRD